MRGFKGSWWKDSALLKKKAEGTAGHQASGNANEPPSHPVQRRWLGKLPKWVWVTAGAIIITGSIYTTGKAYVNANTVSFYHVYVNGEHVGSIEDDAQLHQLFKEKQKEYQNKYPGTFMVLQTDGITTKADRAYKPEIDSEQTLQALDGRLKAYARGVELKVNGETVVIVKDQETAQAAIEAAKLKYAPDAEQEESSEVKFTKVSASASGNKATEGNELKSVIIKENIELERTKADPEQVLDVEDAVQALTDTKDKPVTYTVQEGDTLSSIAQQYDMTSAEVMALNPEVEEKYVQIGSELLLTKPEAPITIRTVETVAEKQPSKPETIVRESNELPKGTRKVVRPGRDGVKVVSYSVTKENGRVVAKQWLGQEVVQEALPEVVYKGTKVEKPKETAVEASSGTQFAWPVSKARVTSSYGTRWGRSHQGIDIVGNRTIMASAGGTVVYAGQQSGYGKVVIVDHGNGYRTLYGHLSSISVRNGQSVKQGDALGVMGSTGRSTGVHLHFEIQKNGVPQNPMNYL